MNDKAQLLTMLRDEFNRWDGLLNSLPEGQITARQLPSDLSIKDVVAHLWSWQQRSVARMEAALNGTEPVLAGWPEALDPESEDDLEQINAWIHDTNLEKPWPRVYADWRARFLRFLELSEAVPEADLIQPGTYPWLPDYPLSEVLEGTYEHHEEHLGLLLAGYPSTGYPMLERLSRLPQSFYVAMLVLSAVLLAAAAFLFPVVSDTPVEQLSGGYWVGLALMLVAFVGFAVSSHYLWPMPQHSLASIVAAMGTIGLLATLCRIGREGWSGNTIALTAMAVVFFSLALVFRLRERRSHPTTLTGPNNPETSS